MGLEGKHILLGITGSIAAYKAASLVRLLVKEGAELKVLMTPLAKQFITPLTMATLAKNPVLVDFFDPENGSWNSHVSLGLWADLYLIAPATANTVAKMSRGIADNLLLTTYLSSRCPVWIAPAMDMDMYAHPATAENLEILRARGNRVIEPVSGELASGLEGQGRMEEPERIAEEVKAFFEKKNARLHDSPLRGKRILVTAGPTHEKIDPVRFIGNYSSGKMGYALAGVLAERGAQVTLVSGPVSLPIPHPEVKRIMVTSASEMHQACITCFPDMDMAVMAAAVADFTPVSSSEVKIKREGRKESLFTLSLQSTTDIAADLGAGKKPHQILAGFALETDHEEQNAIQKMIRKKLDFIVLNSLRDPGAGFQHDTNRITLMDSKGEIRKFELKRKEDVAEDIADKLATYC